MKHLTTIVSALAVLLFSPPAIRAEETLAPWQPKMAAASDDAENMIKGYKVPADLKVELFAAEPLLAHPVALCCDNKGRFYVAETWRFSDGISGGGEKDFGALDMRGHMDWLDQDLGSRSPQEREAMLRRNLGDKAKRLEINSEIVRVIEDSKGSGKADKSAIFADGFNSILDGAGAGVIAYKGSVYFTCIPNLWRLQDTKNVGVAYVKKVIATGFGARIAFLGHDLHGLAVGPDGKLYFSIGDRGYNVTVGGKQIDGHERGGVFRCNADGSEFEVFATGLRNPQKLAFDKYGNLFTADNNADHGDSARWVYVVEGSDSGWRGGYQFITQPNVLGTWTAEKMWFEQHEGQPAFIVPPIKQLGQGPSGVAYYPGTGQLPERYENHFFYCDYKGNGGVFSFSVKPKGAGFEYVEDKDKEFFWKNQATDMVFGIDGAAYACVWVSGIQKTGKGRIYRIADPKMKDDPAALETKKLLFDGMEKRSNDELAKLLEHRDMRVRQAAQFALADKGAAASPVFVQAMKSENQLARMHAIWGLGQIAHEVAFAGMAGEERDRVLTKPWDEKTLEPLLALVGDKDAEVVAQAAKILGDGRLAKAQDALIALLKHENLRVRFFAALALGKLGNSDAVNPLCAMLAENADKDAFLRHAGVMAMYWTAAKYPDVVLAKSSDASTSVRMAVLLVLRRMENARIAAFLKDKSPLLVLEAARAINDVPIAGAFPELAAMIAPAPEKPEKEKEKKVSAYQFKAEYWEKIEGRAYKDFIDSAKFKTAPADKVETYDIFETPSDRGDHYGSRVSGIITPAVTGNYTFWIAVDDWGELFLSSDENPANKKRIAETHAPQWCKPREWYKYPNQKSSPQKLEAGKKYYIEALMLEVERNDNLAVGWQLPDGSKEMPIGNTQTEEGTASPLLVRRALNANFRLGGAENATALAEFAARKEIAAALRVEALGMLADWAAPPVRDKIMNLVRPLNARDPGPAAVALQPFVERLLTLSVGNEIPIAVAQASGKLQLAAAIPALQKVFDDAAKNSDVRAAALNALFELKAEKIHDDVRQAMTARDANLKKAASAIMAKLSPKDAVAALTKTLADEKTPVGEKQNAFGVLAGMKSVDIEGLIGTWMGLLANGKVAPEIELDLLEAAQKSESAAVKDQLAKYNAALPRTDHKTVQLSDYKAALVGGNAEAGRKIFFESATAQCTRCHKVDGKGGDVGPELRGVATREKREYLLESIVDPSAKIAKGFESVAVRTTDGRMISGILKSETDAKVTIMPGDGKAVEIPKSEIKTRKNQEESTMPPLTGVLTKFEIRHLVEYLSTLK